MFRDVIYVRGANGPKRITPNKEQRYMMKSQLWNKTRRDRALMNLFQNTHNLTSEHFAVAIFIIDEMYAEGRSGRKETEKRHLVLYSEIKQYWDENHNTEISDGQITDAFYELNEISTGLYFDIHEGDDQPAVSVEIKRHI